MSREDIEYNIPAEPFKMASVPSFMDWSRRRSENLMETAEDLLEKLEDVSDLLTEIEEKYIKSGGDEKEDAERDSVLQQFRDGLDSARSLVGVLKREKWRLNKREMSVELRMGELEDYKSHLKTDMSSLNETVDALSVRVVQLENSLCEAQETQEGLEAELEEAKNNLEKEQEDKKELLKSHKSIEDELKTLTKQKSVGTVRRENDQLQFELTVLQDENSKLKEMIRDAESRVISPAPKDDTPVPPQRHKSKAAASASAQLKRPVENGDTPEVYL